MYSFQVIVNIERKELHVDFFFFCVGCGSIPDLILSTNEKNKQTTGTRSIFHVPALVMERNQSIDPFNRFPPNSTRREKKINKQKKKKKRKKKKNGPFFFLSFLFYFYLWFSGIFWYPDTLRRECTGFFLQKKEKMKRFPCRFVFWPITPHFPRRFCRWVVVFFFGFRRCSFVFDPKQPVLLVVDFFGVFLICIFQFDWFPIRHSFLVDFFPKKNIKKRVFFGLFFP